MVDMLGCRSGGQSVLVKLLMSSELSVYIDEARLHNACNSAGSSSSRLRRLLTAVPKTETISIEIDELVDSLRNITLESSRLNQENMATQVNGEVQPITLQMLKMFVDTVPSFNGNSDTLPSFISSCDYMFNTFTTTDQTIQNYLIRVVQTKLVGRAQLLVGCRTELTSWSSIKSALEQCFGDNRSLECLEQDLFLAAPFKNEPPMDFGKRLQVLRSSLAQKLTLSEPSSVIRTAMLKQYEGVCLRAFIRGLPGPLQTIIRLKNPDSLERALTYVVEEQNFQYTQNIFKQRPNNFNTPRFPSQQFQPFNNNIRFQPPVQQSQQTFQSAQNFPSQPINIQTVPVQRHFPTNREVFGPPKNANVFKPTGNPPSNHPQPIAQYPLSLDNGDVIIPESEINGLYLPETLTTARDGFATTEVYNYSDSTVTVEFRQPLNSADEDVNITLDELLDIEEIFDPKTDRNPDKINILSDIQIAPAPVQETDEMTVHTAVENPVLEIPFTENVINRYLNQIVILQKASYHYHIVRSKPLEHNNRITLYLSNNVEEEIVKFFKEYVDPMKKYWRNHRSGQKEEGEIDELVDSLRNITLESSRLNQENMAAQVNGEVQPITLQMLKMFVDTVPSFNGNSDTLPSFISSCDYMFNTFTTTDQTIQNYLIRVVQTKLVGRAQLLVECRTELTSWSSIKSALRTMFGDNRSLECLEQDLFLAAPLKMNRLWILEKDSKFWSV
nr:unnamed protein product [Callosobruchus analis]